MLKSLLWSFLEQGGSKAVALIVQIVLARILAPDDFGILAIMLIVVEIANALSQSGIGTALIQRKDADIKDCDTAAMLCLAVGLGMYVVVFFASSAIALFYGIPELEAYLRVLTLAVPVNAFNSIQRSLLQKNLDFKSIFRANLAAVTVSGVFGIALAVAGFGVWALVVQVLSQSLLACAVMFLCVSWRPHLRFNKTIARKMFGYGWKIMVTGILNVVYNGVSELILGKACGATDLGLYSQGRKWPNAAMSVVGSSIQNVIFPKFAELQDDANRLAFAIRRAISTGSFVVVPLAVFLTASANTLVLLLLTEKWAECVPVFQLTSLSACVLIIQSVNLRAYMALGDSGLYLKLQIIKVVLLCSAIWPTALLTRDIYWTALVVVTAGIVCVVFIDIFPAKRMHGVGALEQLSIVLPIVAISVVAGLITWSFVFLSLPNVAKFVLQIVSFCIVYLGGARLFHLPGFEDLFAIVRAFLKKRSIV